jgi:hypothetical protein
MLRKHNEIEIPVENPFANDKLARKKIVENLSTLIQSADQSFVVSIEAPWGFGKTTFIKMWKTILESRGHVCLYFNAWETDFIEDPLIAFVGEIGKLINDKSANKGLKSQLKKLQDISGKIVRRTLPLTIQIATQGLLSQDSVKQFSDVVSSSSGEIAGFFSELAKEKVLQYENEKKGINDFRRELERFAQLVVESKDKKSPLVFFIDELDRCKPTYSLALLERIKHIFSVQGVVFVLGVDRRQLENSVQAVYGQKIEVDGYLRKFIDFSYKLPNPTNEEFCRHLFDKFGISNLLQSNAVNLTIRVFSQLSSIFKFSLRTQEQCLTEINLVLRTTRKGEADPVVLAFLVALRAYNNDLYSKLSIPFGATVDEVLDVFISTKEGVDFIFSSEGIIIQSALINDVLSGQERLSWIENYKRKYASVFVADITNFDETLKHYMSWSKGAIKHLIKRISITEDFVI